MTEPAATQEPCDAYVGVIMRGEAGRLVCQHPRGHAGKHSAELYWTEAESFHGGDG